MLLVAEYPQRVDVATITEMLWPGSEPSDVRPNLRVLLHKLRSGLGSVEAIASVGDTWRLAIEGESIDSVRFESVVTGPGSLDLAALDSALSLWRGDAAGGSTIDNLRSWQTRLETLRLDTEERRIEAMLTLGRTDVLESGVQTSAQARLRWQLGAAVDVLAAHGARDAAASAQAFSGFVHLPSPIAPLSDEEIAVGRSQGVASSLLNVAADTARALRLVSTRVRSSGGVQPSG